jgi:hypothetical protein
MENTNPMGELEASISTLVLSIASSALASMGMVPNPTTEKTEKNLDMARFHIDLLLTLQNKTKNNLSAEEKQYMDAVVGDLQLKFVQSQSN